MSTTKPIPNLLSLRKPRTSASAPLRSTHQTTRTQADNDSLVRETDNDASSSRVSAVEAGYLDDPFARALGVGFGGEGGSGSGGSGRVVRRLPLMNRGTYVRTTAIDRIVDTFLSCETRGTSDTPTDDTPKPSSETSDSQQQRPKQIISLGAGSDTRYFRLKRARKHTGFTYHELDFPENNRAKISRLKDSRCIDLVRRECDVDLNSMNADVNTGELSSEEFSIHAIDLRDLPETLPWLDTEAPTLIISECCLIYLSPEAADNALSYFSRQLANAPLAMAIYEPFRPNDAFGQTMIHNLMTRGIVLKTIEKYADLEKQKTRLRSLGMEARASDCEMIWRSWVSPEEKERVDKLEWMDEVEEFVLLVKHYCVAWGWSRFSDDVGWRILDGSIA